MIRITPTKNAHQWPRSKVESIECRKRDLVIRIADWTRESPRTDEPGYDVEVYIGGFYDWNESKVFSLYEYGTKAAAKKAAITFANKQTEKLL